ncbi:MAG: hypothetical protein PUC64_05445 [Clostridium sp.]|nr:hypothetical protein [Clostridium sp.]
MSVFSWSKNLNYPTFENVFVKYCNGVIETGLKHPKTVACTAQNIDTFILFSSIMDEDERVGFLGRNYEAITKDTLSAMRTGSIPVRKFITTLFGKSDAVTIVKEQFIKKVPQAIVGANRISIVDEYWRLIRKDEDIPLRYKDRFREEKIAASHEIESNNSSEKKVYEAFCLFLADVFVFAMYGDRLVENEIALHPVVSKVLADLRDGKRMFLYTLLDEMFGAIMTGEPEGDNYELKSVNESEFSNDDYRTVAFELLKYTDSLGETHRKVLHAIRMFAVNLDQRRAIEIGGMEAVDALYKHYGFSKKDYSLLSVDPNVTNAEFDIVLQDGKPAKVIVTHREDGTTDIQVIGKE